MNFFSHIIFVFAIAWYIHSYHGYYIDLVVESESGSMVAIQYVNIYSQLKYYKTYYKRAIPEAIAGELIVYYGTHNMTVS